MRGASAVVDVATSSVREDVVIQGFFNDKIHP